MMTLQRVRKSQHPELANAMRPYLTELGAIEDYPYLPLYWTEPGREASWIEEHGNLAGFALTNTHTLIRSSAWSVSEFYVAPHSRRKGIGRKAAHALLALHPGYWEIGVLPGHSVALRFWLTVLAAYPGTRMQHLQAGEVVDWQGDFLVAEVPPDSRLHTGNATPN